MVRQRHAALRGFQKVTLRGVPSVTVYLFAAVAAPSGSRQELGDDANRGSTREERRDFQAADVAPGFEGYSVERYFFARLDTQQVTLPQHAPLKCLRKQFKQRLNRLPGAPALRNTDSEIREQRRGSHHAGSHSLHHLFSSLGRLEFKFRFAKFPDDDL